MASILDSTSDEFRNLFDRMRESLALKWNSYIPHVPHPRQRLFLMLPHMEAFFGGAAGGGKSDALLMAALQYVDIPGYSALLLRRHMTDMLLAKALIDRSFVWLADSGAHWDGRSYTWTFPGGAKVTFGYLDNDGHLDRYQSSEFQFIGFDELSQFPQRMYEYMFSRLRKPSCQRHGKNFDLHCQMCLEYHELGKVPLRMRSASNPPRSGHFTWLKDYFQIKKRHLPNGDSIFIGSDPTRPHIPSKYTDNPAIGDDYAESLSHLDVVTRGQLLGGDWDISEDSRIRRSFARYWSWRNDAYCLGSGGRGPIIYKQDLTFFGTLDPAASKWAGPGDERRRRGMPSWTVMCVWGITRHGDLLLLDVLRGRWEIPDVIKNVEMMLAKWKLSILLCENNGPGMGVYQTLAAHGKPVQAVIASTDKIQRSIPAVILMERGKVFFPEAASFLGPWEAELYSWTGHPEETDDQVDNLSYAGQYATGHISSYSSGGPQAHK